MGCGASLPARRAQFARRDTRNMCLAAEAAPTRDSLTVIPPEESVLGDSLPVIPPEESMPCVDKRLRGASLSDILKHEPVSEATDEYKYFCPLCMLFYRALLEVPCCREHICADCLVQFCASKGAQVGQELQTQIALPHSHPDLESDLVPWTFPAKVPCPHCSSTHNRGRALRTLLEDDVARRYGDSPATAAHLAALQRQREKELRSSSPLRPGDSFGTMARKMLPLELTRAGPGPVEGEELSENSKDILQDLPQGVPALQTMGATRALAQSDELRDHSSLMGSHKSPPFSPPLTLTDYVGDENSDSLDKIDERRDLIGMNAPAARRGPAPADTCTICNKI